MNEDNRFNIWIAIIAFTTVIVVIAIICETQIILEKEKTKQILQQK